MATSQETMERTRIDESAKTVGLLREISDRLAGLERVLSGTEEQEGATLSLRVDPEAPGTPAVPGRAEADYREHLDRVQRALMARKALRRLTEVEAQGLHILAHAQDVLAKAASPPGDPPAGRGVPAAADLSGPGGAWRPDLR